MQKVLSPNQFLFDQAILQVLKQAKKIIKIAPFQTIQPQELVKNNNGNLYLDLYHHYLVAAMTNQKTKQLACIKYEKILRENLFNRDHLPPQMISSILSGCSNTGGSTTGSSHGSANISQSNQQNENLYVVNLIKTILLKTPQTSSQTQLALTYILQGTRNKRFATFYNSVLEEIYNTLLVKIRQEPVKRLVHLQLNHMCNEIEYHFGEEGRDWVRGKVGEDGKRVMCVHDQKGGKGKFGKCFICSKEADNYCKDQMAPVCSFQCKYRLKEIVDSENNNDFFNLMAWLIDSLPSGDQIIYSFLGRQLPHHCLSLQEITSILKIIVNIFTTCSAQRLTQHTASVGQPNQSTSGHYIFRQIQKHCLNIFLHILFNYKHVYEKQLAKYFKVFFFEIVRILELISIKRLKINEKSSKGSKGELIASKESLQSSLNVSLDSMGNMQSMNNMAQNNPNVTSYLNYQQQFSNPFLNGIIQILSNEDLFFYIYSNFDCKFFEQNLLAKMMNIISQYAKEEIISKEYGFGITGSSAYGVYSILKMLTERVVGYEKHKNLRTFNLEEENKNIQKFLKKYPVNHTEVELKRQLPKIIEIFNKKPLKGIIALKKLFAKESKPIKQINQQSDSTIKETNVNEASQEVIDQENQYEKDVQQIKRRAQKLERQNLEASQLSIRNPSIDHLQESTVTENLQKEEHVEDVNIEEKEEKQIQMREEVQNEENSKQTEELSITKSEEKVQEKPIEQSPVKEQKSPQKQSKPITTQLESFITSKQIAMILRQNVDYDSKLKKIPLFQKEKIAEYVGSTKNKEATQICYEFFKLDQPIYSSIQIDDCLRIEFNYFGLPKQGQQIQIVIDELSKVMLPHTYFQNALNIFQYIYTLLMVQSGHNPNVKENDKVKLQMFLSMVNHITQAKGKAQRDFHRIKQNSLNNLFNWGEMIFDHKYLMNISSEDWLFEKLEEFDPSKYQKQDKDIINLKWLMEYIWEYVYISIVNNQKKNSTLGVFEAIVLYGKYGLVGEQFGFMEIFKRSYDYNKSKESLESLLRLGIEFNNYLYQWSYLISLSYVLEQSNTYHEHIDKIFTNLQYVHKSKLKIFLVALCEFSTSEFKSDKGYNRELFVLRHITQILEYNLGRLEQVWDQIWGTIEAYFKGICLHPKKQISMAAIDSYKQLSLKIFKLKQSSQQNQTINHSQVLQTYLYIFERSNIFIKDLIINILQNVVSNDINSGWEIIYEILNINDSEDKTVVMKVVERLVKEVGYKKLTSLEKLHMILIKELRVNVATITLIEAILNRLWQVSQEINKQDIWLETMRSVKDIYKMSLNNKLLGFFFKICNKCISDEMDESEERRRKESFDMMKSILVKQHLQAIEEREKEQLECEKVEIQRQQQKALQDSNISISLDREIYTQIVDWLIFLMDTKNDQSLENRESYILIVKQALQHFKSIKSQYIIRYLVGVSGLLNVFSMFLNSEYKIVFLLFFRDFLKEKLFGQGKQILVIKKSPQKFVELMVWINEHFKESIPSDLLAMKKLDEDFKKERKDLIYTDESSATHIPLPNSEIHKIELIEFSLSAQDFNIKSISNLILLDCVQVIVKKSTIEYFIKKLSETKSQKCIQGKHSVKQNFEITLNLIYRNLVQNYEAARKTNNLIALRNFLWNNGFLLYNTFKDSDQNRNRPLSEDEGQSVNGNKLIDIAKSSAIRQIPGLHKHQKRALGLILRELPDQDNYVLDIQVLEDFIVNYRLKVCLDEEKTTQNGLKKRKRQQSFSRGRKISQILKNDQPIQNTAQKQKLSTSLKPSHDQQQQTLQHQPTQTQRQRKQSTSSAKGKHIQVIEYEKKSSKASQIKPRINIIPSAKSEKAAQNQVLMKQMYLNDVEQWIRMMEGNLQKALANLLKICSQVIDQKEKNNSQVNDSQNKNIQSRSFLLNDQQIVKIFLLCLDLTGEENCSLGIMRNSSTLMQRLLKTVMAVQIYYGFKDESEMQRGVQLEDQDE